MFADPTRLRLCPDPPDDDDDDDDYLPTPAPPSLRRELAKLVATTFVTAVVTKSVEYVYNRIAERHAEKEKE